MIVQVLPPSKPPCPQGRMKTETENRQNTLLVGALANEENLHHFTQSWNVRNQEYQYNT